MSCRSGCPTPGSHQTWGACARAADLQIDRHGLAGHRNEERSHERRLDQYASARSYGLQPKNTSIQAIRECNEYGGVEPTPLTPGGNSA